MSSIIHSQTADIPYNMTTTGFDDIFVAKYDPMGNLSWVRKAGGSNLDIGYAVAVDNAGNLLLTGFFSDMAAFGQTILTASGASPARDIFVAKLAAAMPPRLEIDRSGGAVQLSWPAAASDFLLELTTDLPAVGWSSFPGPTNIVGQSRVVTLTNSDPRLFFRLRK
jgi:hypothetical protein